MNCAVPNPATQSFNGHIRPHSKSSGIVGPVLHSNPARQALLEQRQLFRELEGLPFMPLQYAIVAFSHLRWDFVYQRPQHLLSRLAASRPVFFIEEPELDLNEPARWERPMHTLM